MISTGGSTPTLQSHPRLGVSVALANEEQTIRDFLDRVQAQLGKTDRIYCVLDNVCKDKTREIIAERAARDPQIVLVWAPENRCVVDAYFRGYRAAFEDRCDWILEMDGGLSHLPEEIPQFIAGMQQGFDYVGGTRFAKGGSHKSPLSRVMISRGGTLLANALLKTSMSDMTSGFECFNRKAMNMVLTRGVASRANFFQTEIRAMMHELRWMEVPITYCNARVTVGRSSIREAFRILWAMRRSQPAALRLRGTNLPPA